MLYSSVGHRESEMPERVQKMPSHVKSNLRQSLLIQEWEMEEYFFCALRRTTSQTNTRYPTLFDTADIFRFFSILNYAVKRFVLRGYDILGIYFPCKGLSWLYVQFQQTHLQEYRAENVQVRCLKKCQAF